MAGAVTGGDADARLPYVLVINIFGLMQPSALKSKMALD